MNFRMRKKFEDDSFEDEDGSGNKIPSDSNIGKVGTQNISGCLFAFVGILVAFFAIYLIN
jgi:hypothetical protein